MDNKVIPDKKICPMCHYEKPQSEFAGNAAKRDGLQNYCKSCRRKEYLRNKDSILRQQKAYYQQHKREILTQQTEYASRPENLERKREYDKKRYMRDPKMREQNALARQQRRQSLLGRLGGSCVMCGFVDWRALQIDHINGQGKQDRKRFHHTYDYYKYLLELPLDQLRCEYQVLCANCNWIKRYEHKEN